MVVVFNFHADQPTEQRAGGESSPDGLRRASPESLGTVEKWWSEEEETLDDAERLTSTTTRTTTTTTARSLRRDNGNQADVDSHEADDDGGPMPANVMGAGRRLVTMARQAVGRRAADVLNGGAGLVRMGSGLGSMFGRLVRRNANSARQVAREGFDMAGGLGDTVGRGAVKAMRGAAEVGRDATDRLSDLTDTAVDATKRWSRMAGAAVATPVMMSGDVADVGTAALSVPKNASRRAAVALNRRVLSRLGADDVMGDDNEATAAAGSGAPAQAAKTKAPASAKGRR